MLQKPPLPPQSDMVCSNQRYKNSLIIFQASFKPGPVYKVLLKRVLKRLLSLDLRSVSSTTGVGKLLNLDLRSVSSPSGPDGPFIFSLNGDLVF